MESELEQAKEYFTKQCENAVDTLEKQTRLMNDRQRLYDILENNMRKEIMKQLKSYKTRLTTPLKKAFEINKGAKLFATASFLLLLGTLVFIGKPIAQMVKQKNLSVHQEALALNQEVLAVNQEALALNKETLAVNQEVLAVHQETLAVNKENLSVKQAQAVQAVNQAVNKDIQNLIKKQFKATFKQITVTNLEPAPINF